MSHECHARGCAKEVPPKMFMCASDWRQIPKEMQDRLWAVYVPGQEIRKDPTPEYTRVAMELIRWLAKKQGKRDF